MAPNVIDLKKLRRELAGGIDPGTELPAPPPAPRLVRQSFSVGGSLGAGGEEKLLETAEAAHPEGFDETGAPYRMLLSWQALEYEPGPDQNLLKVGLGGLLLIGAAVAFILRSHLFGILLLVAGAVVVSYAFRAPRPLSLAITSRGVKIVNRIYEFRDLKSFWVAYDPPLSRDLILESKKTLMPTIRIPLGDTDPLQIREVLLRFLPEVEREESLLDVISKRLGF